MKQFRNIWIKLIEDESGQDLIEYALLATLIGLAAITAMGNLATAITNAFGRIVTALAAPAAGTGG